MALCWNIIIIPNACLKNIFKKTYLNRFCRKLKKNVIEKQQLTFLIHTLQAVAEKNLEI